MHLANIPNSFEICFSTKLTWNWPDLIGVCPNAMLRNITVALCCIGDHSQAMTSCNSCDHGLLHC